ncbi:hypothetical protein BST81_17540 [Leptolyngbya sp. 'hensonii']|uniref:oxygen-dependent tRNA uridine(34) hydroxylase TrhO n=1 Tax=Leptolyngbya sp. 'hensonii' TaxID=1922337 RepID=UPI00094F4C9F|nr:rhodanese-related sulfurtransferase [Leptolyngbya sp. 'hensonii']OLP17154.1 hypothetical protein BST81_17540 [Leptolyngbya sp. 'hensonii']
MEVIVATFYKFVRLPDYAEKREPLLAFCQQQGLRGTLLLAEEGINGTIAGSRAAVDAVLAFLRADPRLTDLYPRESTAEVLPFDRMKVRLKREIVTLGMPEVNPGDRAGTYVAPQDWNDLISDPEILVIDTRNGYEVGVGTFKGAIDPHLESFREFPAYVQRHLNPGQHRKVAMFCTGGIRCEKASAYMLSLGFPEVYHLQGGILHYLEEVPPEDSLWEGECFVFDQRVAVEHGLSQGTYDMCPACGHPLSEADRTSEQYEAGVSCPYCA